MHDMTETAEIKLARVEEKIDALTRGVADLSEDVKAFGGRITRLEEATRDAVPQVWKLKERVAELERDTANLQLDLERLRQDYEASKQRRGNRWWDVAKMALSPAVAALVMWLLMRQWG